MDPVISKYKSSIEVDQRIADSCEALMERDIAARANFRLLSRNLFGRGLFAVSDKGGRSMKDDEESSSSSSPPTKKRKKMASKSSSQVTPHFGEFAPPAVEAADSTLDPGFQQYIATYYNRFLEKVFYHLVCFGYFVWVERTTQTYDHEGVLREIKYPEVVANGLYKVKIGQTPDYNFDWLVYPSNAGVQNGFVINSFSAMSEPDPNLKIYLLTDNHPHELTGRFRSTISILLEPAARMRELLDARLNAERLRGNPPVFIEHEERKQESRLGAMVENIYANPAMLEAIDPEAGKSARRKAQEEFENAQIMEQNFSEGGPMRLQTITFSDPMSAQAQVPIRENYRDRVFVVPRGLRVASQPPPPQVSPDILEMELRRLEDVSFTMGVPGTFTAAGQAKSNGATKADAQDFRMLSKTIKFWQGKLLDAVTDVFHTMHPPEEGGFVHFRLPILTYVEQTTMFQLVDQDVIKLESAKRYLAHAHGLEDDDVLRKGQKNVHDRPTLWGTERATESFIQGDAEVKKSEAVLNTALVEKAKADAKAALRPPTSASS